jgi:hypothetical protein
VLPVILLFPLASYRPILVIMSDMKRGRSARQPGWRDLIAVSAALMAWLLLSLESPAGHMFLRGQSTGRRGEVYLCCLECETWQRYPELPKFRDESAWICQNPLHKGRPQERVAVYPDET